MSVMIIMCCSSLLVFFLMIRRPPRSTRTDTLFPHTTLFRSTQKTEHMADSSGLDGLDDGFAAIHPWHAFPFPFCWPGASSVRRRTIGDNQAWSGHILQVMIRRCPDRLTTFSARRSA